MEDNNNKVEENYIKGELIHMIFTNHKEHFSIAKIKVLQTNEEFSEKEVVIKGYFNQLNMGEPYVFRGDFIKHKKFGLQYQVVHYERYIPDTEEGLVAYLSSELFHGVGKKTAERIVKKLGETAVSKILKDPSLLDDIRGLTKVRAEGLHQKLQEHQGFEHVVVRLSKYGFGLKMAQKIYQAYKDEAINILESNPYQYVFDIDGVGFQRADEVAKQHNIEMNHPSRIQAGCMFCLQDSTQNGHVYLPIGELIEEASRLIQAQRYQISEAEIRTEIQALNEEKQLILEENEKVFLPILYYAEAGFTTQLNRVLEQEIEDEVVEAELLKIVGQIEEDEVLSYGIEQFDAIKQALTEKVMILTGGPGTGKTTVIKGIIKSYEQLYDLSADIGKYDNKADFPFVLTAPTGRAAKRMNESTGLPAVTIHRLLGWDGNESFEKDEDNQLNGKLLVIDEFSMVDVFLANQLFKAIPKAMQVLIVGDEDQLPSVGPGQVLADLLASELVPAVKLEEVYRQKEGSKIIQLAHEMKQKKLTKDSLQKASDFNFIACNEGHVVDVVKQIVTKAHEKGVDLKDIQVLAPMYRSQAGIHQLNEEIQKLVNPKRKDRRELRAKDVTFRTGDKVIQLVNQAEDGVFNGDIGEITAIFQEDENVDQVEQVVVSFDEKDVVYERKDLLNLMHAYCISIHKSQGSEFPIVILPVVPGYRRMLRKNLLYTALTRAKQSLIICGDKQAFLYGVQEEDTNKRYTTLTSKLKLMIDQDQKLQTDTENEEESAISPYDFL
ncbi:ATP-dependent RecD-like DNA helicase [Paraliobacillus sediminis]|uniref:SF1B family DNA helicase RecD2 n=1 Tax=Paraliobacillus sediminis TaxID=1885916 RepID=UPI000E3CFC73|nr:ATP-dependent RecD-like DNA helicase [Paraliobacillus sediminis]